MPTLSELLSEQPALLGQAGNGRGLLAVDPAGDGGRDESKGLDSRHGGPTNPLTPVAVVVPEPEPEPDDDGLDDTALDRALDGGFAAARAPMEPSELIGMAAMAKLDDAEARLAECGAETELIELTTRCSMPAPAARPRSAEAPAMAAAAADREPRPPPGASRR